MRFNKQAASSSARYVANGCAGYKMCTGSIVACVESSELTELIAINRC